MISGGVTLLVAAVWKRLVICVEIKQDQETAGAEGTKGGTICVASLVENDTPMTELSSLWVGFGLVVMTIFTGINVMYTFTEDKR